MPTPCSQAGFLRGVTVFIGRRKGSRLARDGARRPARAIVAGSVRDQPFEGDVPRGRFSGKPGAWRGAATAEALERRVPCALRWRERGSAEVVGYLAGDWIEVFAVDAGVYDHNSVVLLERLVDLVEFAGVVDPVASRAERSGQLREVW
jgi:hypothetical protein